MNKNLFRVPMMQESLESKAEVSMNLSILLECLLVCQDEGLRAEISAFLGGFNNLEVASSVDISKNEPQLGLIIITYSGNIDFVTEQMDKLSSLDKAMILLGDDLPPELLRHAVQLQIKDLVPISGYQHELTQTIKNISTQLESQVKLAPIVSILNAKGGSGATFISHGLSDVLGQQSPMDIVLFDGDFQHATLSKMLAPDATYFLNDAINELDHLDALAVRNMMSKNETLRIMPVQPFSHLNLNQHDYIQNLTRLLAKVQMGYDLIVADLSRGIESVNLPILEASQEILLLVQPDIVSVREAQAVLKFLMSQLGKGKQNIVLLVNRYDEKNSPISLKEIQQTLGLDRVYAVRNNFSVASECNDLGRNIVNVDGSRRIVEDLIQLVNQLSSVELTEQGHDRGFWSKMFNKVYKG
ncbi:CpaE family protein [Thalassotalea sp. PS06]|uniref:AAA family ATPase n=1 Tax=Thalassotalea sp. PS06 TaxID=2594005 RepID=UPI001164FFB3|nr:AAA family ATPase [Thalassotalea sp. PS06]QDP02062.1 AAA family ATPase [Thalassotalea sp. PS06]